MTEEELEETVTQRTKRIERTNKRIKEQSSLNEELFNFNVLLLFKRNFKTK
jgi:hypothetical protein